MSICIYMYTHIYVCIYMYKYIHTVDDIKYAGIYTLSMSYVAFTIHFKTFYSFF